MNGAESLVRTLLACGVDHCFANPGTSEMHFLAALDRIEGMRSVLCLFEGVASGAADGYARMTGRPAATLFHLGPGLANGLANLHNARRARSPLVNIVGDHASYHRAFDTPLTSDVEAVAEPFSDWIRTAADATTVASDAVDAVVAARTPPGRAATLILPADTAWNPANETIPTLPNLAGPNMVADGRIERTAELLRTDERCLLLIAGGALSEAGLAAAGRVAAATGADLLTPVSNPRIERGAGRVVVNRLRYPVDQALAQLQPYRHIVLIGAKEPVAFFAYPGKPSRLAPEGCRIERLAAPEHDLVDALERLAEAVGAPRQTVGTAPHAPAAAPTGRLDGDKIAAAVSALMPENAIVTDESISVGRNFFAATQGAAPHSWLQITGGAIGQGLPLAVGVATACPERKVISLQADGSAMYTVQALWTQAREGLDVTTIILSNRSYAILQGEMRNVGVEEPGATARDMMELQRPALDWVALAKGMGVDAAATDDAETFTQLLGRGLASPGPSLIEAVI